MMQRRVIQLHWQRIAYTSVIDRGLKDFLTFQQLIFKYLWPKFVNNDEPKSQIFTHHIFYVRSHFNPYFFM